MAVVHNTFRLSFRDIRVMGARLVMGVQALALSACWKVHLRDVVQAKHAPMGVGP